MEIQTTRDLIRIKTCVSKIARCKVCGEKIGKGKECAVIGADGYRVFVDIKCARSIVKEVAIELGLGLDDLSHLEGIREKLYERRREHRESCDNFSRSGNTEQAERQGGIITGIGIAITDVESAIDRCESKITEFKFNNEREAVSVSVMLDHLTKYKLEEKDTRKGSGKPEINHVHTVTKKRMRLHW